MKNYQDFMTEISADELYKGLLGYGLFSEKIPPMFSSKEFYDFCKKNKPAFNDKWRSYIRYESMRNTNVIRELGIPTPMAYHLLCSCVKDNWDKLKKHFSDCTENQKHIISRTHIRRMVDTDALFKMNYDNWRVDGNPEIDLLIGSKYIVRADISKFFPSIYSHSLPWALVGKQEAKKHATPKHKELWYNKIDHFVQMCKHGETHGLLIGPHASNMLSEIILVSVDKELYNKGWKFIRHIDDYTCYVETYEKAQLFLVDLNSELRKYDLSMNDKKTDIAVLPTAMSKQWKRQIENPQNFYRSGRFDFKSARSYFDSSIEIMQNNDENAAILNYAIKALPVDDMTEQAKALCTKTIFHLCLLYPYLVQIMDEFVFERFKVSIDEISDFSNQLYKQGLHIKNYDAVSFALYFAIKYNFSINGLEANDAIESNSCLYKLLVFLLFKREKNTSGKALLRTHAKELKKSDEDFDQNWLFVFEILPKSDLPDDWKIIKDSGVSFLKKDYQT